MRRLPPRPPAPCVVGAVRLARLLATALLITIARPVPTTAESGSGVVLRIDTQVRRSGSGVDQSGVAWIDGGRLRFERTDSSPGSPVVLFDGASEVLTLLDPATKTYLEISPDEVSTIAERTQARLDAQFQAARAMLARLPEQERARVEAAMRARGALADPLQGGEEIPLPEIRRSEEQRTIDGLPCTRYDVLRDGERVREVWVADWKEVGLAPGSLDAFGELDAFYRTMKERIGYRIAVGEASPFGTFGALDGFPVLSRHYADGRLQEEVRMEVIKVEALDAALFAPPDGYERKELLPASP